MNKFRYFILILLLGFLMLSQTVFVNAQSGEGVVYAVLFYSPSCPHCHTVIDEHLPPLQERFGDQLQVLYVNVQTQEGSSYFRAGCEALNIPDERCGGVPNMMIGTDYMVGSAEIPQRMPDLVEAGIASGGIELPPIPALREAYYASLEVSSDTSTQNATETQTESTTAQSGLSTSFESETWQDRFQEDPFANGIAVVVLGLLAMSFLGALSLYNHPFSNRILTMIVLGLGIFGVVIAGTLAFSDNGLSLPSVIAMFVTGILLGVVGLTAFNNRSAEQVPRGVFPLVVLAGLLVASYMAYVEVGNNEAVCGAVGDCNTVQQSDYAELFGIVPIGILGVLGYLVLLAGWVMYQQTGSDFWKNALFALTLFGTAFSAYLTFLEPFIIGATCAWCLTSALLMLLLLWIQMPLHIRTQPLSLSTD